MTDSPPEEEVFDNPLHVHSRRAVLCSRVALSSLHILCEQEKLNQRRQEGVLGADISYPALLQLWDDLYLLLWFGSH